MLSKFPRLRPLLEVGAFSFEHLRALADCLFGVTDDHRHEVEDAVAGLLSPDRPSQAVPGVRTLRRKLTEIVDRFQPEARPVDPEELGMDPPPPQAQMCFDVDTRSPERTVFHITMPTDEGIGFLRIVDAVAEAHNTTRSKALAELVHGQARDVAVTLNCYRNLDTTETHLESTGLDRIATERWLARVTDLCIAGHSEIEGYQNSDHQRATVTGVDGTCRFPGCDAPAATAQIDHVAKYDGGGKTATWAEQSLCPACHSLKTRGLWDVTRNPDGSCWWTSIEDGHVVVDKPTGPLADACLTFDKRLHRRRKTLAEHNTLRLEHLEKTRAAAEAAEATEVVPF
ncbi:MAG TPA: HNH endonuclease [Candidatus Corynebacterium avicola]|uniref:HNH endonuclease n=1 Tax=Candidatus Corynebacterium avicola TaxID=2838527 RepID=A0A9D1UKA8_9CORY|nr:HNH endonuclease [Candidatus Corynebacterium avicola]